MTAQDSRAMFEAEMKKSPAYKSELMKLVDGRYELDAMESAYHGFILGMESAQPVARTPLTDERLKAMWAMYASYPGGVIDFARAAIAASCGITQEKQG